MNDTLASPSRRHWLRKAGVVGSALGTLAAGTFGNLLSPARAAWAGDYKALVCVFLYGGNDGLNMVVPLDASRYAQYGQVRGALALPLSGLLPMDGSGYGLHPAMSALLPVWAEGRLAPVFNVGPLHEPLSKAAYRSAAVGDIRVPDSLFSHPHQQSLWESGTSNVQTRTGWGGRAAQTMATINPVIATGGSGRFGMSSTAMPLVVPGPGAVFGAFELGTEAWRLQNNAAMARASALRSLYGQSQDNDLGEVQARLQRDAFLVSSRLGALVAEKPGDSASTAVIDGAFAKVMDGSSFRSPLGAQLYQIAKLIANAGTVQGNRQIFFAELGGFDTHANQVAGNSTGGTHANLLKTLSDSLGSFQAALQALGLSDAVTTFTQSDFGRTFAPNNNAGTDHAWGNIHLVMGGAVHGGQTYGRYPQLVLGGDDDVGTNSWELQGRWLPSTSVDQYAATLLSWFGADDGQLDDVLPNLRNFGANRNLGFV